MSRATLGHSRYLPRRKPRPALGRARAWIHAVAAQPPITRDAEGRRLASLPLALLIIVGTCAGSAGAFAIAATIITGGLH